MFNKFRVWAEQMVMDVRRETRRIFVTLNLRSEPAKAESFT